MIVGGKPFSRPEGSQWGMKGKAGSSLPPCPPTARWVSLAKPVASWVPISLPGPGTAYHGTKKFFPVCTFPSYWLKGPAPVSQERHSFPAQHQTRLLVPLTSQICRVSDSLSQLTPDTSHPTGVRPDLQHWPESQGMDSLQKQDLRRPKIHGSVQVSPYQPPTLASLQRLLWVHRAAMLNHVNEVWPNLFLGDAYVARDKNKLTQLGITHVVNVAAGKFQVDTGAKFYRGMPLEYYGIEADDNPFFDLSVYFLPVARYIRSALSVPQGRVLVHCAMGVSRSATVVLAFLMICENMTLVEAIQTVQAHRDICPNSGFLRQLQVLDNRLGRETGRL
uniref:Dual specificity protein phosphatase 13B n=1 Tax=Moschus moschiferus TaxID=68415 RepID=A0A8C6DIM3_MOSMO